MTDSSSLFKMSCNFNSDRYFASLVDNLQIPDAEEKLLTGNYEGFEFPLEFRLKHQHKKLDVLVAGAPYLYLISDKLRKILEENGLTGWKTFSIKLLDAENNEIEGYYGFTIYGKSGPIDYKKCSVVERRYIENGPLVKEYVGFPIDLLQWDNTDFFLPEKNLGIILSLKAAEIIKKNKITNIQLTRLADIVTPEFALKKELGL